MKEFFGKQVIERPRSGSSAPGYKIRQYGKIVLTEDGPEYFGPTKIKMHMGSTPRRTWDDDKNFTDVLGPIKGYLRSSCGRPWDDVFSEISKMLGSAGYALGHIITDHINVATNTWMGASGQIYYEYNGTNTVGGYRGDFYVHPWTGILCEAPQFNPRVIHPRVKPAQTSEAFHRDGHDYRLIKGVWYDVEVTMLNPLDIVGYRVTHVNGEYLYYDKRFTVTFQAINGPIIRQDGDPLLKDGRRVKLQPLYRRDEGPHETVGKKRQLGKKDLRDLKLRNK